MGLFIPTDAQRAVASIARRIYDAELCAIPSPYSMSGNAPVDAIYEGMVQALQLLDMAVAYNQPRVFAWLGAWAYVLMARRMPKLDENRIKVYYYLFVDAIIKHLDWMYEGDALRAARDMLEETKAQVKRTNSIAFKRDFIAPPHDQIKRRYLDYLLNRDMDGATWTILSAAQELSLADLYTQVIQNVMYEVGELWHQNLISVAQEHYCSAATQTIMAQLYPQIIHSGRRGRKVITACVASELHELGARMVSDLFASQGWDSIFLGAALPLDDLIDTIKRDKPDLCALSLAMKQGLPQLVHSVKAIKAQCPDVVVAVGGCGLEMLTNIQDYIDADLITQNAWELLDRAERLFED